MNPTPRSLILAAFLLPALPLRSDEFAALDFENFASGAITAPQIRSEGIEFSANFSNYRIGSATGSQALEPNVASPSPLRLRCAPRRAFDFLNVTLYDLGNQPQSVAVFGEFADGSGALTNFQTSGTPGVPQVMVLPDAFQGVEAIQINSDAVAFDNFFFIKRNDAPVRMRWAQVNRLTGSGVLGYADLRLPNAAGVGVGDFRMARYEVTNAQYARFLNAVDPEGANALDLYDARMTSALEGGIIRNASRPAGHRYYTVRHMADKPANFIDLPDAARFANWLHSGQADPAYTESGAYGSVGASSVGVRAAAARVFLPTEGEWHMAAYHAGGGAFRDYPSLTGGLPGTAIATARGRGANPDFALPVANYGAAFDWNGSVIGNVSSVGTHGWGNHSPWGIADLAGNVEEWTETLAAANSFVVRGGDFASVSADFRFDARPLRSPGNASAASGFRLAAPKAERVNPEFVYVGDPGNEDDPRSAAGQYGGVAYPFYLGKYEVTNAEYALFLNAVDPLGANALDLYILAMGLSTLGGIDLAAANAPGAKYVVKPGYDDRAANYITLPAAMRFCNWLHNGQGGGSTESGAYAIPAQTSVPGGIESLERSPGARYWLPTRSEWRKAAYYAGPGAAHGWKLSPIAADIPMQAAIPGAEGGNAANFGNVFNRPANVDAYRGSASYYGAHCLAGNVSEWIAAGEGRPAVITVGNYASAMVADAVIDTFDNAVPSENESYLGFRLCMAAAPPALDVAARGNGIDFKFTGSAGRAYVIEYDSTFRLGGAWRSNHSFMGAPRLIIATGAPQAFTEPSALNSGRQFYRAREVVLP